MADHARFSPSKMQRIIACPGSIALESAFPDSRSSYADEGTVAHDMAARCLNQNADAKLFIGHSADVSPDGEVTHRSGNAGKFKIDQNFADNVQIYIDLIRRRAAGKTLLVEQRVEFSNAVGQKDQFGTSDAIIIDYATGTVEIWDLKFGMGVKVYAADTVGLDSEGVATLRGNEQPMTYMAGVLETFAEVLPDEINKVVIGISQPRLDHEDLYECTLLEVQQHIARMREAVGKAACALALYQDDKEVWEGYFQAGDKQCKFCKAKAICPTLAAKVGDAVLNDFKAFSTVEEVNKVVAGPMPRPAGPDLIGARFAALDLVEEWVKATRAEVERMVFAGMSVIGPDGLPMALGEGKKGNRAWVDEQKAEAFLLGHMSVDKLYKPRQIVSPADTEKFFKGKTKNPMAAWADVKKLFQQAPGKPKVVLGSDPCPRWTGGADVSEFQNVAEDPAS